MNQNMMYKKLLQIFPTLKSKNAGHHQKLNSDTYMDFNLDILDIAQNGNVQIIALSHYGVQNGDCMADPDMGVYVNHELQMLHSMHYQNDYMNYYKEAARFEDGKLKGISGVMIDQNIFLSTWLNNLIDQGFKGD